MGQSEYEKKGKEIKANWRENKLNDSPDVVFIAKLALARKTTRKFDANQDIRKKWALNFITSANRDSIVLQAHQCLTSSDVICCLRSFW